MSSVSASSDAVTQTRASKRPKCATCRKPFEPGTGKRVKIYCSTACKSRAQRTLAKAAPRPETDAFWDDNVAGQAAFSAPKTGERFSSNAKIPSAAGQRGSGPRGDSNGRDARFTRRDRHQTVSAGRRFRDCGLRLAGDDATVMAGSGAASIAGLRTCNNVHLCPWCMAKILAVRAANIQAAADGLAAAGYGLALGTNTLRHFTRQPYGSLQDGHRGGLVAVLHDAWKGAFGSAGRPWRRLRDDWGVVGYERAFEDTWGSETGWHLHWHTLWVFAKPLTVVECRGFQRAVARHWREAVLDAGGHEVSMRCDRPGCPCGGEGHGTDVRLLGKGEEGEAARYVYKDGDKGTAGIGMELTRSDFKEGRTWGRMSPLRLGDLAADELEALGEPGPLVAKYQERERGVHKVRKHYRTQGLNKLIKALEIPQDTRTETEITGDEGQGLVALAVIPARTWYRFIAYWPGRRLALIRAAESLGAVGVRTMVESWGLVWGRDVFDPPTDAATEVPEVPAPANFLTHIKQQAGQHRAALQEQ